MEVFDIPIDEKLSEKLTLMVPYLYTDTAKLLLILELLNIFLILYNFFVLTGLKISNKTRIVLGNIFVFDLITKIVHLASICLIYDRTSVTLKNAFMFIIVFSANTSIYCLNKLLCYVVFVNDKIMKSDSLKNWKVLTWIHFITVLTGVSAAAVIVYERGLLATFLSVFILIVIILNLYLLINIIKKEYRNYRYSNEVSEDDKVRLHLLRMMIYVPYLVTALCIATIKKQNILDVFPVLVFLYFIYLRRVSNRKHFAEIMKKNGDVSGKKKEKKAKSEVNENGKMKKNKKDANKMKNE